MTTGADLVVCGEGCITTISFNRCTDPNCVYLCRFSQPRENLLSSVRKLSSLYGQNKWPRSPFTVGRSRNSPLFIVACTLSVHKFLSCLIESFGPNIPPTTSQPRCFLSNVKTIRVPNIIATFNSIQCCMQLFGAKTSNNSFIDNKKFNTFAF